MPREYLYLQDIVEAVNAIERFLKNVGKDDFFENELVQSAVLQKLAVLGEASARLSDELKSLYPQVPWKQIIGFRNIAIHAYFSVKWEIVWTAATDNAPILREEVIKILKTEFPDFELRDKS